MHQHENIHACAHLSPSLSLSLSLSLFFSLPLSLIHTLCYFFKQSANWSTVWQYFFLYLPFSSNNLLRLLSHLINFHFTFNQLETCLAARDTNAKHLRHVRTLVTSNWSCPSKQTCNATPFSTLSPFSPFWRRKRQFFKYHAKLFATHQIAVRTKPWILCHRCKKTTKWGC